MIDPKLWTDLRAFTNSLTPEQSGQFWELVRQVVTAELDPR